MSTRTKLVILELISGLFGWGWLIAAGVALYFLVMAVGFDGSWLPFVIAVAVSGVCKWLARGLEDNKRRVAIEADMMDKGMSREEAAASGTSAPAPAGPKIEENRLKAEERARIIADYGEFIEHNPVASGVEVRDVTCLPHDKEAILDAICLEIVKEKNERRLEALKASALFLADFQEGVGNQPLSKLGVDVSSVDAASMSGEDLKALAGKIAGNPDKRRFEAFEPLVEEDRTNIEARVSAAEELRREMPEEKKREILG